ncbi:MAG: hypothetical protein II820_10775 [Ruminiclostridium sp.]|nr:hypothetical protein [Ruminiclostridium sp.]
MRRSIRNTLLTVLCGALIAGSASCAFSQTYPLTIDGEKIRAGIYVLEQQNAVGEAVSKLSDEQPDLDTSADGFSYLSQTVEGKSFSDWVNDKTIENCRNYVAVNRLFDQYGLTLPEDETAKINSNVKQAWTEENMYAQYYYGVSILGEYYEGLGIGEQSFKDVQIESSKRSQLFDHLYGEGGELAATQEEINAKLVSDYATVNFFPYELESGDSAQAFADRIASGETYEDVYRDYAQALAYQDAAEEAAQAAADAAAAAESAEGETAENTDAAAESTETPEVEVQQVEVAEKDSLVQIIEKDSDVPSEEFVKQVFEMNNGDVKVITVKEEGEDHEHVYVVQKLDILTMTEITKGTVDSIRTSLKSDEFTEKVKSTGAGYSLTEDSSKSMYKIDKLLDF